ncbi:MAG: HD domain-containing phosphohydrolase [Acetobacterales bacterium]
MPRRLPITITILVITLATTGTLAVLLLGQGVLFGTQLANLAAKQRFEEIADRTAERVVAFESQPRSLIDLLELMDEARLPPEPGTPHPALRYFIRALETNPSLYAIYVGHPNGDFYDVISIGRWASLSERQDAPPGSEWAAMSVTGEGDSRRRVWEFLDRDLNVLGRREEPTDFDPRTRPWYIAATATAETIRTEPYVYASLAAPGITLARRISAEGPVLGIDVTLATLSGFMADQRVTENSTALLFNRAGVVTAFPDVNRLVRPLPVGGADTDLKLARVSDLVPALWTGLGGKLPEAPSLRTFSGATGDLLGFVAPVGTDGGTYFALLVPTREILAPYRERGLVALLSAAAMLIMFLPLAWYASRRLSSPIRAIAAEAGKLEALALDDVRHVCTRVAELSALSEAVIKSARSIADHRSGLLVSQRRLQMLVDFGIALSAEKDEDRLMEMILLGAKELAGADAGTLYIREGDNLLRFEIMRTDSLGVAAGGTTGKQVELPPVMLRDPDSGEPNHRNVVSHAVLEARTVNIRDAYASEEFDFSGTRRFDEISGYRSTSFLTVPLRPRNGEPIGAFQLINAQDGQGKTVPFSEEIIGFVEALAAQAAVALDNRNLVEAHRVLLDSFIELIAAAIDAKSPYTGGHCARVPELAVMLAREASRSVEGEFAEFRLESDDEWREFRIAAWLHDCGKVTTPEYVVDKATKLETVYNRIHEVRTRFEVLRRDAEIRSLKAELAGEADVDGLRRRFEEEVAALESDFAFVAACNVGGEFMDDADVARLREIASHTWLRHFDDRLGLSGAEAERLAEVAAPPLPAVERLLTDRPEHLLPRPSMADPTRDERHGFRMQVPEHAFNLGEVYNLSIRRGTLTAEERYKINEHIVQTIIMLRKLPLPKHLARVPEYAGGHHETMIGTGYPRGLTREEMSVPARIMAVADVFEALTASDRPYRKSKTLSEALSIMARMAEERHLDAALFRLFVERGIWRRYAERYLRPDQIDPVDVGKLLA